MTRSQKDVLDNAKEKAQIIFAQGINNIERNSLEDYYLSFY